MWTKIFKIFKAPDKIFAYQIVLHRRKPEAKSKPVKCFQKVNKFGAVFIAIRGNINPNKHHFFNAFWQFFNLGNNALCLARTATPTKVWNYAIRAKIVATILDFDKRALFGLSAEKIVLIFKRKVINFLALA